MKKRTKMSWHFSFLEIFWVNRKKFPRNAAIFLILAGGLTFSHAVMGEAPPRVSDFFTEMEEMPPQPETPAPPQPARTGKTSVRIPVSQEQPPAISQFFEAVPDSESSKFTFPPQSASQAHPAMKIVQENARVQPDSQPPQPPAAEAVPQVRVYPGPNGYMIREYLGPGGILIRENVPAETLQIQENAQIAGDIAPSSLSQQSVAEQFREILSQESQSESRAGVEVVSVTNDHLSLLDGMSDSSSRQAASFPPLAETPPAFVAPVAPKMAFAIQFEGNKENRENEEKIQVVTSRSVASPPPPLPVLTVVGNKKIFVNVEDETPVVAARAPEAVTPRAPEAVTLPPQPAREENVLPAELPVPLPVELPQELPQELPAEEKEMSEPQPPPLLPVDETPAQPFRVKTYSEPVPSVEMGEMKPERIFRFQDKKSLEQLFIHIDSGYVSCCAAEKILPVAGAAAPSVLLEDWQFPGHAIQGDMFGQNAQNPQIVSVSAVPAPVILNTRGPSGASRNWDIRLVSFEFPEIHPPENFLSVTVDTPASAPAEDSADLPLPEMSLPVSSPQENAARAPGLLPLPEEMPELSGKGKGEIAPAQDSPLALPAEIALPPRSPMAAALPAPHSADETRGQFEKLEILIQSSATLTMEQMLEDISLRAVERIPPEMLQEVVVRATELTVQHLVERVIAESSPLLEEKLVSREISQRVNARLMQRDILPDAPPAEEVKPAAEMLAQVKPAPPVEEEYIVLGGKRVRVLKPRPEGLSPRYGTAVRLPEKPSAPENAVPDEPPAEALVKASGKAKTPEVAAPQPATEEAAGYVKITGRKKTPVPAEEKAGVARVNLSRKQESPAPAEVAPVAPRVLDVEVALCDGAVLNLENEVAAIEIEDRVVCDTVAVSSKQIAVVGKSAGNSRIHLVFADPDVRPIIVSVTVSGASSQVALRARWGEEMENELQRRIPGSEISLIQLKDRFFLKGSVPQETEIGLAVSIIQDSFAKFQRANPALDISQSASTGGLMLVNMLSAQ